MSYKRKEVIGDCTLYEGDCMEVMPTLGEFDAVVTDPPYGIDADKKNARSSIRDSEDWDDFGWDASRPSAVIFDTMRAASSEQIIWGGNYFSDLLPASMGWLIWDKTVRGFSLADCEMAWTSLNRAARIFDLPRASLQKDGKHHPTQKPLPLMQWCLTHLPASTNTFLDPFMGSGTTGAACVNLGRKFTGIEMQAKYFDIACKRIEEAYKQPRLFEEERPAPPVQEQISFGGEDD